MNKNIIKKDITCALIDIEKSDLLMRTPFHTGTEHVAFGFVLDGMFDVIEWNVDYLFSVYLCFEI